MRDGRDAVGVLDTEAGDLVERAVLADQRDVGAVQRRDELRRRFADDLTRQEAGDGVRDGVVDVQDIEAMLARYLGHLRGQGEAGWRLVERSRVPDLRLVDVDVVSELAEVKRQALGDEVDVVAALGELHAERRGDGAGAADRRGTRDSDVHQALRGRAFDGRAPRGRAAPRSLRPGPRRDVRETPSRPGRAPGRRHPGTAHPVSGAGDRLGCGRAS